MNPKDPTVFLVDDEEAVLKAIGRLLRSHGVSVTSFHSPRQFLEKHDIESPGCLLLDYAMPGMSGLEVQRALAHRGCVRPIIFLTGQADVPMAVQAMKGGAIDILTKPVDEKDLMNAVNRGIERDRDARKSRAERSAVQVRFESLTPREREVMHLVVCGLLNKEIAAELGTVEKTIKVHRARVMEKMAAGSLPDLVRMAGTVGVGPENATE